MENKDLIEYIDKMIADSTLIDSDKVALLKEWRGKIDHQIETAIISSDDLKVMNETIQCINVHISSFNKPTNDSNKD